MPQRPPDVRGAPVTRVVGGAARGQPIAVPDGARPTTDRVREAVFSMIEALRGPWSGSAVLDLYAGSGALGLEALSRGAAVVDLVEADRRAAATIRANARAVARPGETGVARVHHQKVEHWLQQRTGDRAALGGYDIVFCDPPYATTADQARPVLLALHPSLAADAVIVLERSSRDPRWEWPAGFDPVRDRRYGETHVWIAGRADEPPQ